MTTHSAHNEYNTGLELKDAFERVIRSYLSLACDVRNWVSNLSNCSSLLWYVYRSQNVNVNWTGFYVRDKNSSEEQYLLGPFQGKVACQVIKAGQGVCGQAAVAKTTLIVPNVNEHAGHIACDSNTQSEIVVPILWHGRVVALLDIDCLDIGAFSNTDKQWLECLTNAIANTCDW